MLTLIPANALFGLLAALFWGGGDFSGGMGAKQAGGTLRACASHHPAQPLRQLLHPPGARTGARRQLSPRSSAALGHLRRHRGRSFPRILLHSPRPGSHGCGRRHQRPALGRRSPRVSQSSPKACPVRCTCSASSSPASLSGWSAAAPAGVLEAQAIKPDISNQSFSPSGSGAGFGVYFIALKMTAASGVVWPMATARMGSITTCGLFVLCLSFTNVQPTAPVRLAKPAVPVGAFHSAFSIPAATCSSSRPPVPEGLMSPACTRLALPRDHNPCLRG